MVNIVDPKEIIKNTTNKKVEILHPSSGVCKSSMYYGFSISKSEKKIFEETLAFEQQKKRRPKITDLELSYRGILTDKNEVIFEDDFYEKGYFIMGELSKNTTTVSQELLRSILKKKIPKTISIQKMYALINEEMHKYIYYQHEEEYDIVILYIIGSMFYTHFNYYPILHFFADMGSGKTISGKFIEKLGFNGYYSNNITKAALSRELNNRKGIIIIDEKENINDNEELKYILNSCYSKGSQESLTESTQPGVWKSITLELFAPVVICSIHPIYGATSDRIKDKMCIFGLKNWHKVKQNYNKYENKKLHVSNRSLDIFKPLLTIARMIKKEKEEDLIKYINEIHIEMKTESITTDYMHILVNKLNKYTDNTLIKSGVIYNDVKLKIQEVNEYTKYTLALFGAMMKKIGYNEHNETKLRKNDGQYYHISHKINNNYLERYYFKDETKEVKKVFHVGENKEHDVNN